MNETFNERYIIIKNASFLLPHEFKANIKYWRAQWVLWQQMDLFTWTLESAVSTAT